MVHPRESDRRTSFFVQAELLHQDRLFRPIPGQGPEVLRLTALGMTPAQIARALHISYHTVRNHKTSLRRKSGAKNNLTLVLSAQNSGLL